MLVSEAGFAEEATEPRRARAGRPQEVMS